MKQNLPEYESIGDIAVKTHDVSNFRVTSRNTGDYIYIYVTTDEFAVTLSFGASGV